MKFPTINQLAEKAQDTVHRLDGEFPYSVEDNGESVTFMYNEVDGDQLTVVVDTVEGFSPETNGYTLSNSYHPSTKYQLIFYRPCNPFAE